MLTTSALVQLLDKEYTCSNVDRIPDLDFRIFSIVVRTSLWTVILGAPNKKVRRLVNIGCCRLPTKTQWRRKKRGNRFKHEVSLSKSIDGHAVTAPLIRINVGCERIWMKTDAECRYHKKYCKMFSIVFFETVSGSEKTLSVLFMVSWQWDFLKDRLTGLCFMKKLNHFCIFYSETKLYIYTVNTVRGWYVGLSRETTC